MLQRSVIVSYEELAQVVSKYSNEFLLEQYVYLRDQYTQEAIAIIENEISKRGITKDHIKEFVGQHLGEEQGETGNVSVKHLKREDFAIVEGLFLARDGNLIRTMLSDEKILHFIEAAPDTAPHPPVTTKQCIQLYVHTDSKDAAMVLINSHFDCTDNVFSIKYSDIAGRLNAFTFQDITHGDIDDAVIEGIDLSKKEKDVLVCFGRKLINEIDAIESQQQRIVFFFDNCEDLIEKLESNDCALTKTDLLTALEVLQIYCKDEAFDGDAASIAEELLDFFTQ